MKTTKIQNKKIVVLCILFGSFFLSDFMRIIPQTTTNSNGLMSDKLPPESAEANNHYKATYSFKEGLTGWTAWGMDASKYWLSYDFAGRKSMMLFKSTSGSSGSFGIQSDFGNSGYQNGFVEFWAFASTDGSPVLNFPTDQGSFYVYITPTGMSTNWLLGSTWQSSSFGSTINVRNTWCHIRMQWCCDGATNGQMLVYVNQQYAGSLVLPYYSTEISGFWAFAWGGPDAYWIIDDVGFSWDSNYHQNDNYIIDDELSGAYAEQTFTFRDDTYNTAPQGVEMWPLASTQSVFVEDNSPYQKVTTLAHTSGETNSYGFSINFPMSYNEGKMDFWFKGSSSSLPTVALLTDLGAYYMYLNDNAISSSYLYNGQWVGTYLPITYNYKQQWTHIWFEWDCPGEKIGIFIGDTNSNKIFVGTLNMIPGANSASKLWVFAFGSSSSSASWSIDSINIVGYQILNYIDFDISQSNYSPWGTDSSKTISIIPVQNEQKYIQFSHLAGTSGSYGITANIGSTFQTGKLDFWISGSQGSTPCMAFLTNTGAYYVNFHTYGIGTNYLFNNQWLGNLLSTNLNYEQKWIHLWLEWDLSTKQLRIYSGDYTKQLLGTLPMGSDMTYVNSFWFFDWGNTNQANWALDAICINPNTITQSQLFDLDPDGDSLLNKYEFQIGTNPKMSDTDSDGAPDNQELIYNSNPTDADTDNDGLTDGQEINTYNSNPLKIDTDDDGMNDNWEVQYSLNPSSSSDANSDTDGDSLTNLQEYKYGTHPRDASSPSWNYHFNSQNDGTAPNGWSNTGTTVRNPLSWQNSKSVKFTGYNHMDKQIGIIQFPYFFHFDAGFVSLNSFETFKFSIAYNNGLALVPLFQIKCTENKAFATQQGISYDQFLCDLAPDTMHSFDIILELVNNDQNLMGLIWIDNHFYSINVVMNKFTTSTYIDVRQQTIFDSNSYVDNIQYYPLGRSFETQTIETPLPVVRLYDPADSRMDTYWRIQHSSSEEFSFAINLGFTFGPVSFTENMPSFTLYENNEDTEWSTSTAIVGDKIVFIKTTGIYKWTNFYFPSSNHLIRTWLHTYQKIDAKYNSLSLNSFSSTYGFLPEDVRSVHGYTNVQNFNSGMDPQNEEPLALRRTDTIVVEHSYDLGLSLPSYIPLAPTFSYSSKQTTTVQTGLRLFYAEGTYFNFNYATIPINAGEAYMNLQPYIVV